MGGATPWWLTTVILPGAVGGSYRLWFQVSRSAWASARRGYDLLMEYQRTGDRTTLQAAIDDLRRGIRSTRASPRVRASNASNLGLALLLRSQFNKSLEDVEEAVSLGRQALLEIDETHRDWTKHENNLSEFVRRQAYLTRRSDLADEAVALAQRAVEGTPEDHDRRAVRVQNLEQALRLQQHLRP